MGIDLFGGANGNEDISSVEVNKEFARRFEHNKKREDLQRLDELKKRGLVQDSDDSSEDSDDDEEVLADLSKNDLQFYDALVRVKKNDPLINQKDAKLFNSDDSDGEENRAAKKKGTKEKPLYLKDVVAKNLTENERKFQDDEYARDGKSYYEEQEENKQAFLEAAAVVGGEDDVLFTEKKKKPEEDQDDEDDEIHEKLDEFFGEDGSLNENEVFLKGYLLNKMWIDKDKELSQEKLGGFSEEEDELDKQDKYEAEYNFRFEEGVGDRVLGHSRFVEGSVRKKSNARKLQRKSKQQRTAQKELERREEVKHLKNLKMKDIMEKLQRIKSIAGITDDNACTLDEYDLEEDFDPEEYDKKMNETFSDLYYGANDVDPHFGDDGDGHEINDGVLEKPDFDKEDELLGLPKGWDVCKRGDGFFATREKVLKNKMETGDAQPSDENGEEMISEGGKRKKKKKISLKDKVELEKELEEYYKLDYEDTIGDLKTRFKYASVPSNRYGLTPEELLTMDDRDLNQYVSMKKLAPYRQDEWKVSKQKRFQLKTSEKYQENGRNVSKSLKKKTDEMGFKKHEKTQSESEVTYGADAPPTRRKRRKQRQAELKISRQRSNAYVQSKD